MGFPSELLPFQAQVQLLFLQRDAAYFLSSCLGLFLFTHRIDPARSERQLKEGAAAPRSSFPKKKRQMIVRRSSPFICFPSRDPPPQHLLLLSPPSSEPESFLTSPRDKRGRGQGSFVSFSEEKETGDCVALLSSALFFFASPSFSSFLSFSSYSPCYPSSSQIGVLLLVP